MGLSCPTLARLGRRGDLARRQVDSELVHDVCGRCPGLSKDRRSVDPDDLVSTNLKTQESKPILVVLFDRQRVGELHRCFRPLAVDLMQLAKLRIAAVAGHHAGNIETILLNSEALVVVDMPGQDQVRVAIRLGETFEQHLFRHRAARMLVVTRIRRMVDCDDQRFVRVGYLQFTFEPVDLVLVQFRLRLADIGEQPDNRGERRR
jgi:hypothetical protein